MKYLIALLFSLTASATLNDVDKQAIWGRTIVKNGGFENGKASWTASGGGFTIVTSGSNLLTGRASATWDSGAADQTLSYASTTIPNGLHGKNGVAACKIMTPSGTATHKLEVTDGSSELVSVDVTSSTAPTYAFANFIFPSSGSVVLRLQAVASDEPSITVDDCWLGDASEINISPLNQQITGWTAYTPDLSTFFGTTTAQEFQWKRVGDMMHVRGSFVAGTVAGTGPTIPLPSGHTINTSVLGGDQRPILGKVCLNINATAADLDSAVCGRVVTTKVGVTNAVMLAGAADLGQDATNAIFVQETTATNTSNNEAVTVAFEVPILEWASSVTAYRPDASPASWSGTHGTDCAFSTTSTSYVVPGGDASCTFAEVYNRNFGTVSSLADGTGNQPGITFTPKRAGRYSVCAVVSANASGGLGALQLYDGANGLAHGNLFTSSYATYTLCDIANASSTSSQTHSLRIAQAAGTGSISGFTGPDRHAVHWSITALDQSFPAPHLVNSVVNPSSGVTQVVGVFVTNSGTPTASLEYSDWIDSLTDVAAGRTGINIKSGVFSAAPVCTCTPETASLGYKCALDNSTARTSTYVQIETTTNDAGTHADMNFHVICMGPK